MAGSERSPRLGAPARRTLAVVGVVLLVWLIGSAVLLWQARSSINDGLDRLERARGQLTATELLRGKGETALREARHAFAAAHGHADSAALAPWHVIPLIGQNVRAADALTAAAERVAAAGERAAHDSAALLRGSPAMGPDRLTLLDSLATTAGRAERALEHVDLGPDFFLVGPLGDARDRFVDRLDRLRSALSDAQAAATGMRQLLAGPRRYLVLAANNAEMRAGSGMLLSAGVATFANGGFTIGPMRPTADFALPAGAVALPPELAQLWGWAHPSQEWRNLATTPRFDVTGPLAADMWHAATGETVDGVLVVDPVVLRGLLAAQGPIDVSGRALSAADIVRFVLLDQYQGVSITDPQAGRRDQLGAVASAAVSTLNDRPWKAADLVGQLAAAGRGRHVLAWARDPVEQRAWTAAGIDGSLHTDSLAVSLLNVGGNKLDQFVHVDARLHVAALADGGHDAVVTLRIRNDAPPALPSYVAGPNPSTGLTAGDYQAILAVNGPAAGSLPRIQGFGAQLVAGHDGPTKASAVGLLRLARGQEQTVTVDIRLPAGFSELRIEPSARVPAILWHNGHKAWQDFRAETVSW